jgi:hypothetical protein
MKSFVLWGVTLCDLLKISRHLEESAICVMLLSLLAYSSTLETEVICFPKMLVHFQRAVRRITEDGTILCSLYALIHIYHNHSDLFCRGQEQTDSSLIEDTAATTPQRLTPAKFSTAHVKGNANRVAGRQTEQSY